MALLKVPDNLPQLVSAAFRRARNNKDLSFFPTQVAVLNTGSSNMQLRYAPSLAHKPKSTPGTASSDPFASPPAGLYIAALSPTHYLVLNKFAIAPDHFILATTQWASQDAVLAAADLAAAHACVRAYRGWAGDNSTGAARLGLLMFFNSGAGSGASQPHRHLQMLPLSSLYDGLPGDSAWGVLCDAVVGGAETAQYEFGVFGASMAGVEAPEQVWDMYFRLYQQACAAVLGAGVEVLPEGKALISYNLVMTEKSMVLCPRTAEGAEIQVKGGKGRVQFNGTVLAGTALVKNETEWDALREDPEILKTALQQVGVSKDFTTLHKL
ncbi:hypothetical protein TD95_005121 [Thielaviopsis punctulata]|uniref:Uncharacterized protein n=1 Tax=Thielaviopsis punctulata TaxID=72032 RepID=A0A0F4ZAJ4_9PEZI|nr:hypothetical protein TD95_005121 [Thielaviopsis punctulata]